MVSGTEKTLTTIADALCDVARRRGVTEVRLVDHCVSPKMKARRSQQDTKNNFIKDNIDNIIDSVIHGNVQPPKFINPLAGGCGWISSPNGVQVQSGARFQSQLIPTKRSRSAG